MAKPKKHAKDLTNSERVGRYQIKTAIAGQESTGRKLSKSDRSKLLRAGAKNIMEGRKKAQTTDSNNE